MSTVFPEGILRRIQAEVERAANLDIGRVAAINVAAKSLTVDLPGGPVSAVRWLKSYVPSVGQVVVVARVRGQWIVQGELSTDFTGPRPIIHTVQIDPATYHNGSTTYSGGSWGPWVWGHAQPVQGWQITPGVNLQSRHAAYAIYSPPVPSRIPAGATVTAAKLIMTSAGGLGVPVSPVVWGHTRTGDMPAPTGPPAFTSGYGPWRPGTLAVGQTGVWDLPPAWLTALLAGTITGIGVWSEEAADYLRYTPPMRLEITYTTPA